MWDRPRRLDPWFILLSLYSLQIDLHTGNVCFTTSGLKRLSEAQVMNTLGEPEIQYIKRRDGTPLSSSLPRYTVKPQPFPQTGWELKIIDLGQGGYSTLHDFLAGKAI